MDAAPNRRQTDDSEPSQRRLEPPLARVATILWALCSQAFNVKSAQTDATVAPRADNRRTRAATTRAAARSPGLDDLDAAEPDETAAGANDSPASGDSLEAIESAEADDNDPTAAEFEEAAAAGSAAPTKAPPAGQSSLVQYSRAVRAIEPLGAEEETALVQRAQAGDARARHRLIECHLGVVIAVARGYSRMNMPVEDLIEEGNLGLMEAVDRFDPQRGVRFASYARWWIREAINHAMTTQSRTVRLPSHVVRGISSVMKAQRTLDGGRIGKAADAKVLEAKAATPKASATQVGTKPVRAGLAELAVATGRPTANVAQLMALSQPALSLSSTVEGSAEGALQDGLAADSAHEPEASLLSKEMLATVLSLIDRLPKVERSVVIQRFGFGTSEPRTLEEVGASVNLTAERVRQLQVQAVGRMRDMLTSRGIDISQFL